MNRTARFLDHWSPPDGAGAPVACLATTFTFEVDFFVQDCLSRFLSLSMVADEADEISSLASLLEEEDRLNEAQVTILVDRSSPAEKRNLRWDLLPVRVPGGLLHAKVAVLIWERAARVVLGSANLTSAGYRRQVELALALDLDDNCRVPRPVLEALVGEVRHLASLIPTTAGGPRSRALSTVDLLASRIDQLDLPQATRNSIRMAVAPARPGVSPFEALDEVWSGSQPLRATVLSPFWDAVSGAPALAAIRRRLTGRPARRRSITAVVATDPWTGILRAPTMLADEDLVDIVAFDPPPAPDPRLLHAKLVLLESDDWLAALIGSSNATEAGFGLHPQHGHQELNMWIGCPADSQVGRALRDLAGAGEPVTVGSSDWEPLEDEDEPTAPQLPAGFDTCVLRPGGPMQLHLSVDPPLLPDRWWVATPAGTAIIDSDAWRAAGTADSVTVPVTDDALPSFLMVSWQDDGDLWQATWTVNVEDRSLLPPPAELAVLAERDIDLLLRALASTRPLPVAIEHEMRRRAGRDPVHRREELDPLRRYDDQGLLLERARQLSLALWRLQQRLGRPASTIEAVHWRLFGPVGPVALAQGITGASLSDTYVPGEAQFFLAELDLTVAAVDWAAVAGDAIDLASVQDLVRRLHSGVETCLDALPPLEEPSLSRYVADAVAEARR